MNYLVMTYFKDSQGRWHQPGNSESFDQEEAGKLLRSGFIKLIQTAMVEAPENRVVQLKRRVRR